jgi:hypothetical protein
MDGAQPVPCARGCYSNGLSDRVPYQQARKEGACGRRSAPEDHGVTVRDGPAAKVPE